MKKYLKTSLAVVFTIFSLTIFFGFKKENKSGYISPEKVQFSPDGKLLAVNDLTSNKIYIINTSDSKIANKINVNGRARDIKWTNNSNIIFSEYESGMIWEVDALKGQIKNKIQAGPTATMFTVRNNELWVSLSGMNKVVALDLNSKKLLGEIKVGQQPHDIELIPNSNLALVANLIPIDNSNSKNAATFISVIDVGKKSKVKDIYLPHGSTNLRNIVVSADGKWAYAVHTRGKINLPTSQLEKGWVISNMLSIIDLQKLELYTSVLLDKVSEGAADPWSLIQAEGNGAVYVTLAGVNEVAEVNMDVLHQYIAGKAFPDFLKPNDAGAFTSYDIWKAIKENPSNKNLLADKISALHAARLLKRVKIPVKTPRGIDVSPDGQTMAVAGYFSGEVAFIDVKSLKPINTVSLGRQPEADLVRTGEILFHNGETTFQTWLSCSSCHPDTRADGLHWDLLNDGIGNPKNTKSMVWTHQTPPVMSTGVRPDFTVAVQKGYHFIQFYKANDSQLRAVEAYLASLTPDISPFHLSNADVKLQAKIKKGKEIFESEKVGCTNCHGGTLFTNLQTFDVGTGTAVDRRNTFDTPTLIELWRTAPYLHSGATSNLGDLLTTMNKDNKHGNTSHLNKTDVDALVSYLLSL